MTTSAKVTHTPGPWMVTPIAEEISGRDYTGCDAHFLVVNSEGEKIVDADDSHGCCSFPGRTWPVIGEADAHLIAAAPDMLEAMEAIVAEADQSNGGKGAKLPIVLYIKELAQKAIAKAKGAE